MKNPLLAKFGPKALMTVIIAFPIIVVMLVGSMASLVSRDIARYFADRDQAAFNIGAACTENCRQFCLERYRNDHLAGKCIEGSES